VRAIYLDAALIGELGHFAGVCREMVGALRGMGIETVVFGHGQMDAGLRDELSAQPLFRLHPNARCSDDPVCGWLISYFETARMTCEDLMRMQGISAEDRLVYDCARPAQVAALIEWLQRSFPAERCPSLLVILGWPSGMGVDRDASGQISSWRLHDQASCLYRLAVAGLQPAYAGRIRFGCPDPSASEAYSQLLGRPVEQLPEIQRARTPARDRSVAATPCLAFLGEQRFDKGYPVVPEIVSRLLASGAPLRILVQNSWQLMEEQNAALRAIAAVDSRLTVRIGTLSPGAWNEQLAESDMVILPYHLSTYATSLSGVGAEAIANGIPQAVPAYSGLERLLVDYGMPGVVFSASEPEPVVQAVLGALANWPAIATTAARARELWAERNTPERMAAALLG